ncbi:MAG: MXAN_6640 family putative metalloprotease, partial [Myxococcota bacterium]
RGPLNDGFVSDNDGGDDKFDIYLVDFAGRGDGQYRLDSCLASANNRCAGHMLLENDFFGYGYPSVQVAIRIVGSHELFHAVQAGYAAGQDVIVSEATAVWATERFDPSLNDFEAFIRRFLERPERSIFVAPSGLVDGYPYSVALFFRFIDERYGPAFVLQLWEQLEQTPTVDDWVSSVDSVLSANYGSRFVDEFEQFAVWNVYTGPRANPAQAYQEGARYPQVLSTEADLPLRIDRPRMFAASARYWLLDPDGRDAITAAFAPTPDSTEGLEMWLVPIAFNGATAPVKVLEQTEVPTQNLEGMMLAVINPQQSGSSLRPTVCVGSPQEVAACTADTADAGTTADAGSPTDSGADAGIPDAGGSPPPESGGCAASPGAPVSSTWWLLLLLAISNRRQASRHRRSESPRIH